MAEIQDQPPEQTCIAFAGTRRIARGTLLDVALAIKDALDRGVEPNVLVFDNTTSRPVEIDVRGSREAVAARFSATTQSAEPAPRSPGRPKLGVIGREVTLLPRHWEWLNNQPGGASVTLRKLVEQARRANAESDRVRESRDNAYRFMLALAGDEPGFEEATRALYAGDRERFTALIAEWPDDVREHAFELAEPSFDR